jgi:REP element-mobilizing transposase RayT
MKKHRHMPMRIYVPGALYAITTITFNRYPYFKNGLLCHLFIQQLNICALTHHVAVYALKINPDHVHMIIYPHGDVNYSQFMFSLKKHFSHNANKIMGYNITIIKTPDLIQYNHSLNIQLLSNLFIYTNAEKHGIPKFKWQHSFYLHRITDDLDFINQLEYIKNQWIKHDLGVNEWCFIDESPR